MSLKYKFSLNISIARMAKVLQRLGKLSLNVSTMMNLPEIDECTWKRAFPLREYVLKGTKVSHWILSLGEFPIKIPRECKITI